MWTRSLIDRINFCFEGGAHLSRKSFNISTITNAGSFMAGHGGWIAMGDAAHRTILHTPHKITLDHGNKLILRDASLREAPLDSWEIKEKGEVVLRSSPKTRQGIKAKFYENDRSILP